MAEGGEGGEGGDDGGGGEGGGGTVPSYRLRDETKAKRAALADAGVLRARVATLEQENATVGTLTARITELEGKIETDAAQFQEELAVVRAGFTDEDALGVARLVFDTLPEAERGTFPDWVKTQSDPEKVHKAMRGYLPGEAAGDDDGGGEERNMGANRPGAGEGTNDGAGAAMSLEQARARAAKLSAAAVKSGDWTQYDKERPGLLARIAEG